MFTRGNYRRLILTLAAMALLAPALVRGSRQTITTMFNAPPLWVPPSLEYRRNYDWFKRVFQCEDTVLLSFPGCRLGLEPLADYSKILLEEDRQRTPRFFQSVTSGPELMANLQADPLDFSRRVALARLAGSFVGPDRQTSCILVVLTEHGGYQRQESLQVIRQTAVDLFDVDPDRLHLAGAPVDGAAIDRASIQSIDRFAVPSTVIAMLLCWWCLRSWILTLLVLIASAVGQGFVLALANFTGDPMNAILIVLPVLVFVLTVSAGVHLCNYYREAVRRGDCDGATQRAISHGWLPCILAALTTVIGLASLFVSDMTPIRSFSLLGSLGIILTISLLFLLLPGGMDLQSRLVSRRRSRIGSAIRSSRENRKLSTGRGMVAKYAHFMTRLWPVICILFVAVMTYLAIGTTHLKTSVNIRSLFTEDSRIRRDYAWLEQHLGPLVPIEIIVQFPDDAEISLLDRMELVRDLHLHVARMDQIGGILSAATFFPSIPTDRSLRSTARRSVLAKLLNQNIDDFAEATYLAQDRGHQNWRISARVAALADVDYGQILKQLQDELDPILQEQAGGQVGAVYTGSLPVAYQAQRALLNDLFRSFLTAFSLVALTMILVLRRVIVGLLVMLPNLFPTLLLFGGMGWTDTAVDIGSVMTASVALGIAVDNTLHFLLWYQRETKIGNSRGLALENCFHHCGRAMVQTTLICGLGMLVYAFSDFVPTQRFALMMLGLLMAAFIGDLVLLPALLVGPCDRILRARTNAVQPPGDE